MKQDNKPRLTKQLKQGLEQLNLTSVTEQQAELLIDYLFLLKKWNKTYNLTAIKNLTDMIGLHLLDSLAVCPYLKGKQVVDVGSGAGLPGIPLAIVCPELQFTLVDTNGKKTRFMQQAVIELGLKNVVVTQSRVENLNKIKEFDTVISRAFASICDMLDLTSQLCAEDGQFLALKGEYPEAEWRAVDGSYRLAQVVELEVPFVQGARHLMIIKQQRGN